MAAPLVFKGAEPSAGPVVYVHAAVALIGVIAGGLIDFWTFAAAWAVVWSALAYFSHARLRRQARLFEVTLDDARLVIQDIRGLHELPWGGIESVIWRQWQFDPSRRLVIRCQAREHLFNHMLNTVDLADFIQALRLKVPDATGNLGRYYYSSEVHGMVVAAHQMRTLKQPDRAADFYNRAIAQSETAGSTLNLGLIPVLDDYLGLLNWQQRHAEAQAVRSRIESLARQCQPHRDFT